MKATACCLSFEEAEDIHGMRPTAETTAGKSRGGTFATILGCEMER
jgi:hypothetical protein